MDSLDHITLLCSAGMGLLSILGAIGGSFVFLLKEIRESKRELKNEMDKRFEKVDERFEKIEHKMDERFAKVDERFEKIEHRMDERFEKVEHKIEKLNDKLDVISHDVVQTKERVRAIETILHLKECCMLKSDENLKKAQ